MNFEIDRSIYVEVPTCPASAGDSKSPDRTDGQEATTPTPSQAPPTQPYPDPFHFNDPWAPSLRKEAEVFHPSSSSSSSAPRLPLPYPRASDSARSDFLSSMSMSSNDLVASPRRARMGSPIHQDSVAVNPETPKLKLLGRASTNLTLFERSPRRPGGGGCSGCLLRP